MNVARPPFRPTEEQRKQVETLTAFGVQQDEIAALIGISPTTLRKHFRRELDVGATKANAKVAQSLFNQAIGGNVTAAIFWLKTRARWKEPAQEVSVNPPGVVILPKHTDE